MSRPESVLQDLPFRRVLQVAADASFGDVSREMDKNGLETAVVIQGNTLLGTVGARQRLRALRQQVSSSTAIRDLMITDHCALKQSTSISHACDHLLQHAGPCLLLDDDDGMPIGVLEDRELVLHFTAPLSTRPSNTKRAAHSGASRQVSERVEAIEHVRLLKQQTELISRFAAALINLPVDSADSVLNNALMEMGKLTQVDRAYIFSYDFTTNVACNTHEWCSEGIRPEITNLQALPLDCVSDWVNAHKREESLVFNDVRMLPPGAARDILTAQDIKSLVSLPILGGDGCIGFLGFDSVRTVRAYGPEELEVLALFARTLANYWERLNTEQKLANSEANFHAFFDQTKDLLLVLSHQGNVIHCNTQAAERLGFSKNELPGHSVLDLHATDDRDEAARVLASMAEGKTNSHAIPLKTRSGIRIQAETSVVAGQWNATPALFMSCRDLSAITASEEKFSQAFHLSPIPMAITELHKGTVLEVNEAFFHVTGHDSSETIGSNMTELGLIVDPDQRSLIVEQLQRAHQVKNVEMPLRTKRGEIVYGLFNAALLQLQGRQVMITQMLDITARKAAEEALADERLRLRTLINAQPNLVWLKDPDGVYLACNSLFEDLYGQPESRILGKNDLDFVKAEIAISFRENDRLAVEEGSPRINEETLVFASSGYTGLFETTKTPIFNNQNALIGVLGVARDITESRHAEKERRRMDRALHQSHKMEALGQLTGGVAHEFNNMLAIIQGYTDLLQNKLGPDTDPAMKTWLDHIDMAGVRAKELVRQLLSFSRPDEKRAKRVNLEEGVRNALLLTQSSLPSSIEIDYQSGLQVPDVQLDLGELQQILTNLLVNARDAMNGKGLIEITLQKTRYTNQECQLCHQLIEGDWVELSIADNGPGIYREQQSRIFEPFFTTKPVGKGTGLGLSLVHSMMEHNGGHILLNSRVGTGTRFRLLFPPLEHAAPKSVPTPDTLEEPSLRAARVLVVDDEPALTEFLTEALELQGLQVVALNDSCKALALLLSSDHHFDLLVTDQTMPGILGTELAIQAKTHDNGLKVILCTGHSEHINAHNAAEFGIDGFLEKPVNIKDILVAIDRLSM